MAAGFNRLKDFTPFCEQNGRLFHHSGVGRVRESIRRQCTGSDVGPLLGALFGTKQDITA